jgi:hypothetical protein
MADTVIPHSEPGVAAFSTATYINAGEPRFGDGEAITTVVNVGANVDLPIYSVISYDGSTIALAEMSGSPEVSDAYGILAAPVKTGTGGATTAPVYRTGHFNMDALNWDASFDTDAKKAAAFEGSKSPTIFLGKPEFSSGNIEV